MVTFTINIPPMLVYIPYMDPMGYTIGTLINYWDNSISCIYPHYWISHLYPSSIRMSKTSPRSVGSRSVVIFLIGKKYKYALVLP